MDYYYKQKYLSDDERKNLNNFIINIRNKVKKDKLVCFAYIIPLIFENDYILNIKLVGNNIDIHEYKEIYKDTNICFKLKFVNEDYKKFCKEVSCMDLFPTLDLYNCAILYDKEKVLTHVRKHLFSIMEKTRYPSKYYENLVQINPPIQLNKRLFLIGNQNEKKGK